MLGGGEDATRAVNLSQHSSRFSPTAAVMLRNGTPGPGLCAAGLSRRVRHFILYDGLELSRRFRIRFTSTLTCSQEARGPRPTCKKLSNQTELLHSEETTRGH